MNKYQEALKWFKSIFREIGTEQYYENLGLRFGQGLNESIETIEELVDKETPMKTIFSKELGVTTCGSCKKYLVSSNNWIPKYCSECGQKIDWGNEE